MFADRMDAARRLAARLSHLRGRHPLVLAIPRGAVPMADHIAHALNGELDVVLVRKLGAPGNPEYAIGAVDGLPGGWEGSKWRKHRQVLRRYPRNSGRAQDDRMVKWWTVDGKPLLDLDKKAIYSSSYPVR